MPVQPRWRRRWRAWRRRSSFGWWVAAAALALLTALVVRTSLAAASAGAARYGSLRTVPVVVAPVSAGAAVPAAAVVLEERPGRTIPSGGGGPATAWAGRTALVPLVPGEVLLASKLAPEGLRGPAALLPDGDRALAVPGGPGGRPPVATGDRVDVLVTVADQGGQSFVVVAGALVLAVDDGADTVTVAVPAADAPALASAIATGGVTLALTGPGADQ